MIQSIKSFTMMLPPHFNMFEYSEEPDGACDWCKLSLSIDDQISRQRVKCVKSGWKYADGDQDNLLQILIQHLGFHKRFAPVKHFFTNDTSSRKIHSIFLILTNIVFGMFFFRRGPGNMIALRCSECIFAHYPVCR